MLASLVVLIASMLGLGWWVGQQIERGVINRTSGQAALYVNSYIDPPLQELGQGFALNASNIEVLNRLVQDTSLGQRIVSFKVWDTHGRILYSSDPALIGQIYPIKEELAQAIQGEVVSDITDLTADENLSERGRYTRLLETYSPVQQNGANNVIAVVEFYQTVDALDSEIGQARVASWFVVGGATLMVYVALAGIVRRGSNTIDQQRAELHQQVERLTELLAQNEELHDRVSRATANATALNERFLRRISAELHDGPAQDLGLALLRLDQVVEHSADCQLPNGSSCRDELGAIEASVRTALKEVCAISGGLGLPDLDRLTLAETLERVVKVHQRRTGTQVMMSARDLPEQAPLPVKITAYRIVQESLSNAFRHANGLSQAVQAAVANERMQIEVSDGGPGFNSTAAVDSVDHLGLAGMRERVESLGGGFKVESAPGQGTMVTAWLPLRAPEGNERDG
jgi:signal transduction histidine kinase